MISIREYIEAPNPPERESVIYSVTIMLTDNTVERHEFTATKPKDWDAWMDYPWPSIQDAKAHTAKIGRDGCFVRSSVFIPPQSIWKVKFEEKCD